MGIGSQPGVPRLFRERIVRDEVLEDLSGRRDVRQRDCSYHRFRQLPGLDLVHSHADFLLRARVWKGLRRVDLYEQRIAKSRWGGRQGRDSAQARVQRGRSPNRNRAFKVAWPRLTNPSGYVGSSR